MKRAEEGNLWKILKKSSDGDEPACEGHVIVYVDDIMALAKDDVRASFFQRLQKEWKCSDFETVNQTDWVKLCGYEMKRHEDGVGLLVGQRSYTMELLKRYEGVAPKLYPLPKFDGSDDDEADVTTADIRAAQAITGELLYGCLFAVVQT